MRAFLVTTLGATLAAAAAACSPYNPTLPDMPFLCGSNSPQCPDGYTCMSGGSAGSVCVSDDGNPTNTDGGGNNNCADDSKLEPNDTLPTAYAMPVDTQFKTFDLAGLSICPSGDVDNYSFTISQDQENAQVIMTYDTGGAPLQMSIKVDGGGSDGTPIINGAAVSGMPGVVKASPSNLAVGTYYVQVFGPSTGGTNNYKFTITITP